MQTDYPLFILGNPPDAPAQAVLIHSPEAAEGDYYLHWQPDGYALCDKKHRHPPLSLDFRDKKYTGRSGKEYLPKALRGIQAGADIADITAGWAKDAWLLAARGFHLTLYERNPYIYTLLHDALNKAQTLPQTAPTARNIRLIYGDAARLLNTTKTNFAAVYLDPMYPDKRKNAKAKKHMQALQQLLGGAQPDDEILFTQALHYGAKRVVVKRPQAAPHLGKIPPDYSISAPNTRYDVYLKLTKTT